MFDVLTDGDNIDGIKVLLKHNALPNIKNIYGCTPLHLASELESYQLLLDANADPNVLDSQEETPLDVAVRMANDDETTDIVKLLLQHGANPFLINNKGRTLLHLSAASGHGESASLFLEKKLDINSVDKKGNTALHLAAKTEGGHCLEVLLDNDAKADHRADY